MTKVNIFIAQVSIVLFFTLTATLYGQEKEVRVSMDAKSWDHDPENVEFITHRSVPAVRSKDGANLNIQLKDFQFTSGTIEYDVEFTGRGFPGIGFRSSEDQKHAELFYIRYFGEVDPLSRYTTQYAPVLDGVNMWDMTDEYQAGAVIRKEGWNHVKLVIHGKQMKVYVNDMDKAALHVPSFEGSRKSGSIYLTGNVIYANVRITPNAVENLPKVEGYDPTYSDTRYLRNWKVSAPVDLPFNRDIFKGIDRSPGMAIDSTLLNDSSWKPIVAERRGMVNLTREFGATERGKRRLVWLKININSEIDQMRRLNLGFSDEVWVLMDGKPLYIDKNYYGSPGMKEPRGRCTLENSEVMLPLKKGDNEILLGVAHYFFGWGITARLDSTDDLSFE